MIVHRFSMYSRHAMWPYKGYLSLFTFAPIGALCAISSVKHLIPTRPCDLHSEDPLRRLLKHQTCAFGSFHGRYLDPRI